LIQWIVDTFPNESADAFQTSLHSKLLDQLALYLSMISHPFDRPTLDKLTAEFRTVKSSIAILQAIASTPLPGLRDLEEAASMSQQMSRKLTQRSKRAGSVVRFDATPFKALDLAPPTTHKEAEELSSRILHNQKLILKVNSCADGLHS
jgi:hypothetical protein